MSRDKNLAIVPVFLLALMTVVLVTVSGAGAQSKFKTLYRFTGGADGNSADSGLIFDAAGNLF